MNYKDVTQKEQPILNIREGNHSNCSFMEVRGLSARLWNSCSQSSLNNPQKVNSKSTKKTSKNDVKFIYYSY